MVDRRLRGVIPDRGRQGDKETSPVKSSVGGAIQSVQDAEAWLGRVRCPELRVKTPRRESRSNS